MDYLKFGQLLKIPCAEVPFWHPAICQNEDDGYSDRILGKELLTGRRIYRPIGSRTTWREVRLSCTELSLRLASKWNLERKSAPIMGFRTSLMRKTNGNS